ncbi:MAG: PIG-L family deacetylase [Thermoanaerobaculia bacterium]|nr:PIG-L family deacetylase [Thermoanaerobaculia bacterium]
MSRPSRALARRALAALLLALAPGGLAAPVAAAVPSVLPPALEPAGTGGLPALDRALAKLSTHRRLLVIAAHPDDEDGAALVAVAEGMGGEAAYLSLSRGEGGQNLIGEEKGAGLGLLRSEELLAARRLDGARQYFTRAHDFGYTRSLAETLSRWPRAALLADTLRIVARFRPQVIVTVFPDDGRGGHGQHQAAGWVAAEAYRRSREAQGWREAAPAGAARWEAASLWRSGWFDREAAAALFPLGTLDPWSGRSLYQIAGAARSQHRSQDMGRPLDLGPRDGRWIWLAGGSGAPSPDLFAGADTSLAGLAAPAPPALAAEVAPLLAAVEAGARELRAQLRPGAGAELVDGLARLHAGLAEAAALLAASADPGAAAARALVEEKVAVAGEALAVAAGLALDATSAREELLAGAEVPLAVTLWNAGSEPVGVERIELATEGFALSAAPAPIAGREVAPGELARFELSLALPADAGPTRPYFLRRPLAGDLYDWEAVPEQVRGEPFEPPPVAARLYLRIAGRPVVLEREVVHRALDQAVGEVRRPLRIVPLLEVAAEPFVVLLPLPARPAGSVSVRLRSHAEAPLAGTLRARSDCPDAAEVARPFAIADPAGEIALELPLAACPGSERAVWRRAAQVGGSEYAEALPLAALPHVRPRPWPQPAEVAVHAFPLALPAGLGRVGYVVGALDRVPEALAAVGIPVERLAARDLEAADLSVYDAIVVGPRAYETEPALARANPRLLDYVRRGGLLVVQYQQYPFVEGAFAPLPLAIARPHDRVTDEASPVRLLEPEHPVFTTPNRLGPADWEGWVQERGLYLARTFDPGFRPLLALQDPGEPEQQGALLVARVGEGTYVYTGLALFRQLPAGVPGAVRLFANLLALGERAEAP